MRTLASVQKILSLEPIEGYDRIVQATVLGWNLVVKTDEFRVGDLCVYCEPDSLLPARPEFEAAARYKYRIKTRRIGSVISQGIAFPLDILDEGDKVAYVTDAEDHPDGMRRYRRILLGKRLEEVSIDVAEQCPSDTSPTVYEDPQVLDDLPLVEGTDLTELLGVTLYEAPENYHGPPNRSRPAGDFPTHLVPKTDETRIQAVPSILRGMEGERFYIMEKVDGSSMTVILERDVTTGETQFSVCSRQQKKLETPGCWFWEAARNLKLEEKLQNAVAPTSLFPEGFPAGIILQGELIGPGIQQNRLLRLEREFLVFNVYDVARREFLNFPAWLNFVVGAGIPFVPVVNNYFVPEPDVSVREMVDWATRKSDVSPLLWAEGIVVRPHEEKRHPKLGRFSFKVLNPEYLLEHKL